MIVQTFRKSEKLKTTIKITLDTEKQSGERNKILYTSVKLALEVPVQQIARNIFVLQQVQWNYAVKHNSTYCGYKTGKITNISMLVYIKAKM